MFEKRSSGLDFADRWPSNNSDEQNPDFFDYQDNDGSVHLQRNISERKRMQGLQRSLTVGSTKMGPPTPKTFKEKFDIWLINEGSRRIFFVSWIFLHLLVVAFGFFFYLLSDNLEDARATFGITYSIARSAALVLYVDVAFILLPVCRNFISFLRRTPLNDFIPFDQALAFHKLTAWAIVAFTVIHIAAHMVNFFNFAMLNATSTTARLRIFLSLNFTTGPGITGWIMTTCLAVIVFFF